MNRRCLRRWLPLQSRSWAPRALRRLVRTRVLEPLALLELHGAPARVALRGGDVCVEAQARGVQPVC